jgi:CxxC-x17-CxxC domain-containing protein
MLAMKNFQPGGLRNRREDIGGRPQSDANKYAPKKRFEGKQSFGSKPSFGGNRDKSDMKLYAATCTTCGKSCEVPFRPDGSKPVLCRDCFANKNSAPSGMPANRDRFASNEQFARKPERSYEAPVAKQHNHDFDALVKQLTALENKVSQILELVKSSEKKVSALPIIAADVVAESKESVTAETKVRKPKKVTPAIVKAAAKKKVAVAKKVVKKVAAKKVAAKKSAK